MDEEVWKTAVDFDAYEVSNIGRVRTIKTGRIRVPNMNFAGYPQVTLMQNKVRKSVLIHILVAKTFIGPAPSPKHTVDHRDRVRANNRLDNLKWATRREQARNNGGCKLAIPVEEHDRIRGMYASGLLQQTEIAALFQVSVAVINKVINRRFFSLEKL